MSEFRVGRRIKTKQIGGNLASAFVGRLGVIFRPPFTGRDVWVRFDEPVHSNREWLFPIEYIELIPLSPEEEAHLEDQERRRLHADQYL